MRVGDLPEGPPPGVALYCSRCERTWSATRSDYFMRPLDDELVCDCEEPEPPRKLELRRKVVRYVRV